MLVSVSSLSWKPGWPRDLLETAENINTVTENSILKLPFFIGVISAASWLHSTWTATWAFRRTLKSFPYIWGYRMRNIHKYKCLFYQTNAYQTTVIGRCAHNKEGWLVHFILWALSSTAEIKIKKKLSVQQLHACVSLQTTPSGRNKSLEKYLKYCEGWISWRASSFGFSSGYASVVGLANWKLFFCVDYYSI